MEEDALKVALRFPRVFWPAEAHFLGKIGGEPQCNGLGDSNELYSTFRN